MRKRWPALASLAVLAGCAVTPQHGDLPPIAPVTAVPSGPATAVTAGADPATAPLPPANGTLPPGAPTAPRGGGMPQGIGRARSGGYYLDDGPGSDAPPDPTRIADAVPREEPLLLSANRPYEALGEAYFPDTSPSPYSERGLASWYGRRFHGHRTSSGEPYDMYGMTAAHKTLPIPSYVRVTSLASGKSVVVRINDRGPFHAGRVIDLSFTAAQKLDLTRKGSGEVLVERVFPAGQAGQPTLADLDRMAARPTPPDRPATWGAPAAATQVAAATPAPMVLAGDGSLPAEARPAVTRGNDVTPPEPTAGTLAGADGGERTAVGGQSNGAKGRFLQLGAFREAGNAQRLLAQARSVLPDRAGDLKLQRIEGLHRVWLGPFSNADEEREAGLLVARKLHLKPRPIAP